MSYTTENRVLVVRPGAKAGEDDGFNANNSELAEGSEDPDRRGEPNAVMRTAAFNLPCELCFHTHIQYEWHIA